MFVVAPVTVNHATLDVPPPGPGFVTETERVPLVATSGEEICAVTRPALTKVVGRAAPFHFTIVPETNPAPLTVKIKPELPGATLVGDKGWLTVGAGFNPNAGRATQIKKNDNSFFIGNP
jgi:hypothetical protein